MVPAAYAVARAPAEAAGRDNAVAVEYEGCLAGALTLLEQVPGRDPARRAAAAMKLTRHFTGQGPVADAEHPDLAERYGRKAAIALPELLADQTKSLGPDHYDTLVTRRRLARWLRWNEGAGQPDGVPGPLLTRTRDDDGEALPPGQRSVPGWPVRHYGPVPRFRPERWQFRVFGSTASGDQHNWNFEEFTDLPLTSVVADLHCVSGKTMTDSEWTGVAATTLLALAPPAPDVTHVMVWAEYGYSANLRLHDLASD